LDTRSRGQLARSVGRKTAAATRRGGYGVAVLLKIYAFCIGRYASCIDGQANAANKHITGALGVPDADALSVRSSRKRGCDLQ
jgi:hypothetical protein